MTLEDFGQLFLSEFDVAGMLCFFSLLMVFVKIIMFCVKYKSIKGEFNFAALVNGFFLLFVYLSEKMILKQPIQDIGFMNYFAVLFATIEFTDNACEFMVKPMVVALCYRFDGIIDEIKTDSRFEKI